MITTIRTLSTMPAHARVWIYKAPRDLGQAEQKLIRERGNDFTSQWAAHGASLDACIDVLHDRFIVVAVDEEQALASGCSIDRSLGFIKQLEMDLNLTLTDRMVLVYEQDGRTASCRLQELPDMVREGVISPGTLVFDDLVGSVGELRDRFRVPLRASWMARFME
ncbi:MAG: hypothetical protein H6595_02220 [Flavobacteriales bacterium]|nr:hypothetical protein [Flavobacteriales bacterium]